MAGRGEEEGRLYRKTVCALSCFGIVSGSAVQPSKVTITNLIYGLVRLNRCLS